MLRALLLLSVSGVFACDDGGGAPVEQDSGADAIMVDGAAADGSADAALGPDAADPDGARPDVRTPDAGSPDQAPPPVDAAPDPDARGAIPDGAAPDAQADGPPEPPPPPATPIITELVARNQGGLADEDGDTPDWVELHNPGVRPYDLSGHFLTDDLDEPEKWAFPEVVLEPGGYLVVFASGKDRGADPLHANFRLAGDGETVALVGPDGVIDAIEDFPGQFGGVAYGLPMAIGRRPLLDSGAMARIWVGPDPEGAAAVDFDDRGWRALPQGAGVDSRDEGPGAELVRSDLSGLLGPADAFWMRVPFEVPAGLTSLALEVAYDDGVAVWLDGELVHRDNDEVGAAADRSESQAAGRVRVPLDPERAGPGVIAVRAVDAAVDDGLFFAHVALVSEGVVIQPRPRYLPTPTPGAPNIAAPGGRPPLVADADRNVPLAPGAPLDIGATVLQTDAPVESATLVYTVMFAAEQRVEMARDGERWVVRLPADLARPGEMIRWRVEATDTAGRVGRFPPFLDPEDSARYVGTMVDPGEIETNLPVYHWFCEDLEAANSVAGTRTALWFDGELYDNIRVNRHGQATTVFPKKSFNFDFNRDHRFRVSDELERVKDFDLLTNYADKSKMRNTMSYRIYQRAGHEYHLVFPVRIHRNGEFFAVYEHVEDPDERWLRRLGYQEPLGAIYKSYDRLQDPNRHEKKSREDQDKSDLEALIAGVNLQGEARTRYIYDNVDLARMANFMALLFITSNRDCCTKNYYAYHDLHTDTWWFLPWDIDLTLGRNWTGTYYNDDMWPQNALYQGNNNRLTTALFGLPEFLEMYHRRVRTLTDEIMQPRGTPYAERYLENEADRWLAHIGNDAVLDNDFWGSWGIIQTQAEAVRLMKEGWMAPRRDYIYGQLVQSAGGPVRTLIDGRAGRTTGRYRVPVGDGQAWIARDFDDGAWAEGPLGLGYENDDGPYAALLGTDVRPTAVNPAATSVQVRVRFESVGRPDRLTLRMKYDDGYVAWLNGVEVARRNVPPGPPSWQGQAAVHEDGRAVRFEDVDITEFADRLVDGQNVLAIQVMNTGTDSSDLLLLPELIDGEPGGDGPLPPAQAEAVEVAIEAVEIAGDESFVVLHNREGTAVDLTHWRLSGQGIEHTLVAGTVIPTDGRLYVVADTPSFRRREVGPSGGQNLFIQGNWQGTLVPEGRLLLEAPE